MELSVFRDQQTDFDLIIIADFLLQIDGQDHIVDISGIGPDIVSLVKEHQFSYLPLVGEADPSVIVARTLEFLGVTFDSSPHAFRAVEREDARNVRLVIPGISFQDTNGGSVLATPLRIPAEIRRLLSRKGFKIMSLVSF
jgi:hypothetical protein